MVVVDNYGNEVLKKALEIRGIDEQEKGKIRSGELYFNWRHGKPLFDIRTKRDGNPNRGGSTSG